MKKLLAICSLFFTVCVTFTGCGDNESSYASGHDVMPETHTEIITDSPSTGRVTEKTTERRRHDDDGRDNSVGDYVNDAVDGVEDAGEDIIDGAGDAVEDVVDGLDGDPESDADR